MAGVDIAFDRLDEVALLVIEHDVALLLRRGCPFELWQLRFELWRAHVQPDQSRPFTNGVTNQSNFVLELGLWWLGRHVHALATDVEFPAMINTAQAAFLVSAQI